MIQAGLCFLLGAVMLWAAVTKVRDWRETVAALAGLGFGRLAPVLAGGLTVFYFALAVGLFARLEVAAWAGAVMMVAAALFLVWALARGMGGKPCGCFGARSRVSWRAVARNVVLAAALVVTALLARETLTTEQWLGLGLVGALGGVALLSAAVLALARQVGELRLRGVGGGGGEMALDIDGEGPDIGSQTALLADEGSRAELLLAVFTSPGCRVCESLKPTIAAVGRHPAVEMVEFDEAGDPDVWEALRIPGSPFAIALTLDGIVLAKGTFNNAAQLESVLATAERRAAGVDRAGTGNG